MRPRLALIIFAMAFALPGLGGGAQADGLLQFNSEHVTVAPDPALAARLFGVEGTLRVTRQEGAVPSWSVTAPDGPIGHIASTWEITESVGYSGRPIDILVAVTREGRIAGARLIRQSEPVLTLGISESDIADYVDGFAGVDLTRPPTIDFADRPDLPDVISRATVSTGVIRDAILRTARTVALALGRGTAIDQIGFRPMSWDALLAEGALARTTVSLDQARAALSAAKIPPPPGEAPFLDLWVGLLDPPTIGRNLLGQALFTRAMAVLGPGETALFVASRGLHSHRGTDWRRTGDFDRIAVIQDEETITFDSGDYLRIDRLAAAGAPDFKEMSIFRLPADGFDPTQSFRVEVTASRDTDGEPVSMRIPVDYTLPGQFLLPPEIMPDTEPLWVSAWQRKQPEIVGVGLMLTSLAVILFLQEAFVRRPALWRWGRITFLTVTLVWLGWIAGGQLSVVQVVAFLQSLLTGFRWETFLIEPVIFMLWGFVALGLLFWGRGVFCGWLCPFGALQELTNEIAKRLRVP
ncbi:MAG TPA: 4Fe-4S binding protein, partial [Aurantimonas sp.]